MFKYKAALVEKTANAVNNTNSSEKNTKIVVPLKYLSNFWRSLEIPLINCKIYLDEIGLKTTFYQVTETLQNLK